MERLQSPQFYSGCVTLYKLLLLSGHYFASIYSTGVKICFASLIYRKVIERRNEITGVEVL